MPTPYFGDDWPADIGVIVTAEPFAIFSGAYQSATYGYDELSLTLWTGTFTVDECGVVHTVADQAAESHDATAGTVQTTFQPRDNDTWST